MLVDGAAAWGESPRRARGASGGGSRGIRWITGRVRRWRWRRAGVVPRTCSRSPVIHGCGSGPMSQLPRAPGGRRPTGTGTRVAARRQSLGEARFEHGRRGGRGRRRDPHSSGRCRRTRGGVAAVLRGRPRRVPYRWRGCRSRPTGSLECTVAADGTVWPTTLPELNEPHHGHGAAVVGGVAYVLLGWSRADAQRGERQSRDARRGAVELPRVFLTKGQFSTSQPCLIGTHHRRAPWQPVVATDPEHAHR